MQLILTFNEGATNLDIAARLRFQAGLFEGIEPKVASSRANTDAPVTEDVEESATPKAKRGRPAKAAAATTFDEDEETEAVEATEESFGDEESFEDETPAPKKAKAAKKITLDDVNDICKAFARENGGGKDGREAVLKILKKNFKVTSISELDVEDYAKVLKALAV